MYKLRMALVFCMITMGMSLSAPSWASYFSFAHVFTMTNDSEANEILSFAHDPFQGLVQTGSFDTGGKGTGGGLGNQGGLALSKNHRWLFAVNAGSDSLSVFRVRHGKLHQTAVVDSQGERPVSVTQRGRLVYVLNAGSDSIAGFELNHHGQLQPLADSVRSLSGVGTAPAQIEFTPNGKQLVVTEKATNQIVTFNVDRNGLPGTAVVNDSVGPTPFGFSFDRRGRLLVSEAAGGAEDASSASSYEIQADGSLNVISGAVPSTETAACWLETSHWGNLAFTTNTGSSSVSAYWIGFDGSLYLLDEDGVAASTGDGSAPIDLALNRNGRFMYVLSASNGTISAFWVGFFGNLYPLPGVTGLPTTLNGMVAY